ncbi:MAG: hypothetical protein KIT80_20490 [Chitinophagaceae bacterium]|nr:hypothetical protein [Chitinophagaceae bacterium]MCW5929311.1 hypothetical protein [Chitinophagaceae bacterium]
MFKIAQKIKKKVAYLLLFSFMNILTFLPGSQIEAQENRYSLQSFSSSEEDEMNRSTILELILENFAGLEDCLPESEKPDFSYDYFSSKFRSINSFTPDMILPTGQEEPCKVVLAAAPAKNNLDQPEELLLHHHHFVFRLTPF